MNKPVETRLSLIVGSELFGSFCLLTGSGFKVYVPSACTIRELLCGQLGIEPDYLQDRIQTVLLNSKAVDDPNTAVVVAGSTIALSAAMPGLAGAMLRKGSPYSPMRSPISHENRSIESVAEREGDVTVKLFNMLQKELGPRFLERGIRVSGEAFSSLLDRRKATLRSAILTVEMNGTAIPVSSLFDTDWTGREVRLSIAVRGSRRSLRMLAE